MNPSDVGLALRKLRDGDTDAALSIVDHLIQMTPVHVTAFLVKARAHDAKQEWHEAMTAWSEANLLLPNNPVIEEGLRFASMRAVADSMPDFEYPTPPRKKTAPPVVPDAGTDESDAEDVTNAFEQTAFSVESEEARKPGQDPLEVDFTDYNFAPHEPDYDSDVPETKTEDEVLEALHAGLSLEHIDEREEAQDVVARDVVDEDVGDGDGADNDTVDHDIAAGDVADGDVGEKGPAETETTSFASRGSIDSLDDLDQLIRELESARIMPAEDRGGHTPSPLPEQADDVVSETLARIYATQRQYEEAARVYDKLATQQPDRSDHFVKKAAEMREHFG